MLGKKNTFCALSELGGRRDVAAGCAPRGGEELTVTDTKKGPAIK